MSGLGEAQSEWLTLFHRLRSEFTDLGAPFLSVKPAGYDPLKIPSVLYVGKATKDAWYLDEFLGKGTVQERYDRTNGFLDDVREGLYRSPFWDFALRLSARLAELNSNKFESLQNLVWTNISKIGAQDGNPGMALRRAQHDLSLRTLILEIAEYRPRLIVFVTNSYEESIVREIANAPDDSDWAAEDKGRDWHWWRPRNGEIPAILWTCHPQAVIKNKQFELERWITKCIDLIN